MKALAILAGAVLLGAGVWYFGLRVGPPTPTAKQTERIEAAAGFQVRPVTAAPKALEGHAPLDAVHPKVAFRCSGLLLQCCGAEEDGIDRDLLLSYGPAGDPALLEYLKLSGGAIQVRSDSPVPLQTLMAHLTRIKAIAATPNVYRALHALPTGTPVRLQGALVFLSRDGRVYETELDPANTSRCKYAYVTEVHTAEHVYR